jgi:cyclase
MRRIRVIPVLLMQRGGLVKSVKFKDHKYVGDPINAVRIFNDKEVDELVILDISATSEKRPPDIGRIREIVAEAFMPIAYGGGITKMQEIDSLINSGIEKVILNSIAASNISLVREAATVLGSQSVSVSIDVKKNWLGKYRVHIENASKSIDKDPVQHAQDVVNAGAGEIILQSVDRDGSFNGYDVELIKMVSKAVNVPVVALGGAAGVDDFTLAVQSGASAVAAGSIFVFQGPHRAVLISYPAQQQLKDKVFTKV